MTYVVDRILLYQMTSSIQACRAAGSRSCREHPCKEKSRDRNGRKAHAVGGGAAAAAREEDCCNSAELEYQTPNKEREREREREREIR